MIILLDTSTPVCKLTVLDGDKRQDYEWEANRELAHGLLGYIEARLGESGKTFHDITGIGGYLGPGSFTGLRIGLTVLNTLADSLGVPIIGATGDDWRQVAEDRLGKGENDQILLPYYGADAHITTPRK